MSTYFQRLAEEPSSMSSFPPESYTPTFVKSLVESLYKHGKPLTQQENLFLISLKSHTSAVLIAHNLLTTTNEPYLLQFASLLLVQALEETAPANHTDELLDHLVNLSFKYYQADDLPVGEKVCRQLLAAVGMILRTKPDWKMRFQKLATAFQADFFETGNPVPKALNVFFIFAKFNTVRARGNECNEWECVEIVVDYFNKLLAGQLSLHHTNQSKYLKILSDWYAETSQRFGTPTERIGQLLVLVAQYIDCPRRQLFPWGDVQTQAADTLGDLLQIPDIHLLQNSMVELLRTLLNFPMNERVNELLRVEGMDGACGYLETVSRVLLKFSFEFADIVVACSEEEKTRGLFYEYVRRLCVLTEPFPEKRNMAMGEGKFSHEAMLAFKEFLNLVHEMCGTGSDVSERLLPDFKIFFGILVKKAYLPPAEVIRQWNSEEREAFAIFRSDVQLTMEALAAAVGTTLYEWFAEEFDGCFSNSQHSDVQLRLVSLCHLLRFSFNSHLPVELVEAIFVRLQSCLKVSSREVVCEAFAAMGVWVPLLAEITNRSVLQNVLSVCMYGMHEKDVQLTGACTTVLSAVADVDVKELLNIYADVTDRIKMNLVGNIGNRKTIHLLFSILGHMIASLVPEAAVNEIHGMFVVFEKMLQNVPVNDKSRLLKTVRVFPAFFQSLTRHMEDEQLPGAYRVYEAIAKLGLQLLEYLHHLGMFSWTDANLGVDDVFADLIKPLLSASGQAVGNLVHVVVPFVESSLSRKPTGGIMRCTAELLTKYLDRPGCEALLARLTLHTINSVITLSEASDWLEYFSIYRPFVLAVYPVIRQHSLLFAKLPIPWDNLINFVAKLICSPPSGDAESQVQISVLFEELMRMKAPTANTDVLLQNGDFNQFKHLLASKYGEKFIEQFLRIFQNPYAHDAEVKVCCECFYAMLAEMPVETKAWIQNVAAAIRTDTSEQSMAFSKLLSNILAQRSKSGVTRQVSTYRQKFLAIRAPGTNFFAS